MRSVNDAVIATASAMVMLMVLLSVTVGAASGEDLPPADSAPGLDRVQELRLGATEEARAAFFAAEAAREQAAAAAAAEAAEAARVEAARRAAARRARTATTVAAPQPAEPVSTTTVPARSGDGTYLGEFTVTCYSLRGTTASGRPVGPSVVAVDPRVIPLGTWIHIEGIGNRQASDTGGDIKGKRLDIWHESRDWCLQFGRRVLSVHRL